jgi:L-amino acid N-acyltransferase YncA
MSSVAGAVGVRAAARPDAAAIATIYNQGIAERAATFDTEEVADGDVLGWLGDDGQPVLVAEVDGRVAGWARVIRSRERCAFAGVGEYTIYLDTDARGRGIGRRLLDAIVNAAEASGYWKLQGRLFTTNAPSVALARRCGFREVGVYERHGRLDGDWKDLLIVERLLGEAAGRG